MATADFLAPLVGLNAELRLLAAGRMDCLPCFIRDSAQRDADRGKTAKDIVERAQD